MKDTEPAGRVVVIFGGRSEIGIEVATRLAPGATVVLAARRADDLAEEVSAVRAAGAKSVAVCEFDADALDTHQAVVDSIVAEQGPIGTAVLAFGILGDQARAEGPGARGGDPAHRLRRAGQPADGAGHHDARRRSGPDRGVLVGRRCAGAAGQLCLRFGEGGS